MPISKHKPTTASQEISTTESASLIPGQEEFRQHLWRLVGSFVQMPIKQVMREELEQCFESSWGKCTHSRCGYCNCSYTRDLATPLGALRTL